MIALYRGVSLLSRAIRTFTRSDYSHAAWLRLDGSVVEAWWPGGVRISVDPYEYHTPGTEVDYYRVLGMDDEHRSAVERFLIEQLGVKYDLGGVVRFVTRRRSNNCNRWFCSELVAVACEQAGIRLLSAEPAVIAPGHLAWSPLAVLEAREVNAIFWRDAVARRLCPNFGGRGK